MTTNSASARLAWFSPMPPVRSGVAVCSAALVAALGEAYDIDVFVADPARETGSRWRSAHEFVWRNQQRPYALTIYQLGNSAHHDYLWPYLFRFPGLVVLHDARLHHARAAALLRERRADDYRAEFAANHPTIDRNLAELAPRGFDNYLYYAWPMTRLVASASRAVAVHNRCIADDLREENPRARIEVIRLGHGTTEAPHGSRSRVRARYGIPDDVVVFGCFGGLSPEKRLPQVLGAFAWLRARVPGVHLLLAGTPVEHYGLAADVAGHGLDTCTTLTGYLEDGDELDACIEASDVGLTLRWPTAREVSGPWLRCLALGKPTVILQLRHLADVPSLDPRDWQPTTGPEPGDARAPVAVAVDILDEDHSLRLAMRRLASDTRLRTSLGRSGRRYWRDHHSVEGMVEDYRRIIPMAVAGNGAAAALPSHLINDGDGHLRRLLEPFGVPSPLR
jgi:glycosyltransferase involved in cell wall biosynthesis